MSDPGWHWTDFRVLIAIFLVFAILSLFFCVRYELGVRYGVSYKANKLYTGTGAAFRAGNLTIISLQTDKNPYLKHFWGAFDGVQQVGFISLSEAFPGSGRPAAYVQPGNSKAVVVSSVAAKAWDTIKQRRAVDQLTPENAQADLAALAADPINIQAAIDAVAMAYISGAFVLSYTRYQPSYCCAADNKTCPVGYTACPTPGLVKLT